jgi:hypothetical protein
MAQQKIIKYPTNKMGLKANQKLFLINKPPFIVLLRKEQVNFLQGRWISLPKPHSATNQNN